MKKKDLKSYNLKKLDELQKEVETLMLDFKKTRLNIVSGREKNLKKAKNINKKISQIMTIIRLKKFEKAESEIKE